MSTVVLNAAKVADWQARWSDKVDTAAAGMEASVQGMGHTSSRAAPRQRAGGISSVLKDGTWGGSVGLSKENQQKGRPPGSKAEKIDCEVWPECT